MRSLFREVPEQLPEEWVQPLLSGGAFRVERIVSRGHTSPEGFWYDQVEHEWVVLVSGAARVRFEGEAEAVEMRPGDYLHIPARRRHRVEWTLPGADSVWLAIHYT